MDKEKLKEQVKNVTAAFILQLTRDAVEKLRVIGALGSNIEGFNEQEWEKDKVHFNRVLMLEERFVASYPPDKADEIMRYILTEQVDFIDECGFGELIKNGTREEQIRARDTIDTWYRGMLGRYV